MLVQSHPETRSGTQSIAMTYCSFIVTKYSYLVINAQAMMLTSLVYMFSLKHKVVTATSSHAFTTNTPSNRAMMPNVQEQHPSRADSPEHALEETQPFVFAVWLPLLNAESCLHASTPVRSHRVH